jgi:hypothetical protein
MRASYAVSQQNTGSFQISGSCLICGHGRSSSPLRDYTGDRPCLVYGIGDPPASVFVPTDAADRWIHGLRWHPE